MNKPRLVRKELPFGDPLTGRSYVMVEESFYCMVCGQPKAMHHPTCSRNPTQPITGVDNADSNTEVKDTAKTSERT